jgi:protein-L-isoaspartate(D-aspartate) O-methyltransferase
MMGKEELLQHLKKNTRVLKSKHIQEAFEAVDRKDFVPEDYHVEAYEDYPLPIGHGQTISQPTTVAFMLELLEPKKGERVLDIGSGSGWTTALLAYLVGEGGEVLGVERVPELVEFGRKNLEKYHFGHVRIERAGEEIGMPEERPYDKILVSAAAEKLPEKLMRQLKVGGKLVIPIGDSICRIEKTKDSIVQQSYPGFIFVPLVS